MSHQEQSAWLRGILRHIHQGTGRAIAKSLALEPISPELALIDPVLARADLARLAAVEQRILALVVQSPTGKLPPTLVDQRTGLAKNNLQAVCNSAPPSSFLCLVRPARHRPGEGLYVLYRPSRDGRASIAWYPYRS